MALSGRFVAVTTGGTALMTVTDHTQVPALASRIPDQRWDLSEAARAQAQASGIALSEVYRLLKNPDIRMPGSTPGYERLTGYGLTILLEGKRIVTVEIDGASAENWSDWARERAEWGDGDVAAADALLVQDAARWARKERQPRQRRARAETVAGPLQCQHVLDSIHPALRDEITRQVQGDFSRLVVHSPTNVTINPL